MGWGKKCLSLFRKYRKTREIRNEVLIGNMAGVIKYQVGLQLVERQICM